MSERRANSKRLVCADCGYPAVMESSAACSECGSTERLPADRFDAGRSGLIALSMSLVFGVAVSLVFTLALRILLPIKLSAAFGIAVSLIAAEALVVFFAWSGKPPGQRMRAARAWVICLPALQLPLLASSGALLLHSSGRVVPGQLIAITLLLLFFGWAHWLLWSLVAHWVFNAFRLASVDRGFLLLISWLVLGINWLSAIALLAIRFADV